MRLADSRTRSYVEHFDDLIASLFRAGVAKMLLAYQPRHQCETAFFDKLEARGARLTSVSNERHADFADSGVDLLRIEF